MTRTFIETPLFTKQWSLLGFTDGDLQHLQLSLLENPETGSVIEGTGGLRKMRHAFKGRGKRGGVRVCYIDFTVFEKIYLVLVYAKTTRDNLNEHEKQEIKRLMKQLKSEAEKNYRRQEYE